MDYLQRLLMAFVLGMPPGIIFGFLARVHDGEGSIKKHPWTSYSKPGGRDE